MKPYSEQLKTFSNLFWQSVRNWPSSIGLCFPFALFSAVFSVLEVTSPFHLYPLLPTSIISWVTLWLNLFCWLCMLYAVHQKITGNVASISAVLKAVVRRYLWCWIAFTLSCVLIFIVGAALFDGVAHLVRATHSAKLQHFLLLCVAIPVTYLFVLLFYSSIEALLGSWQPWSAIYRSACLAYREWMRSAMVFIVFFVSQIIYAGIFMWYSYHQFPLYWLLLLFELIALITLPIATNFILLARQDLSLRRQNFIEQRR